MKSNDLLIMGGIGLLAYMLMAKPEEAEGGGITTFIPIPSTGEAAPFNLGGLADIFKNMPQTIINIPQALPQALPQVMPEINFPEFKFPDIDMPEMPDWANFFPTDWDKFMPDWEKFIPALPEDIIPNIIPNVPNPFDPFTGGGGGGIGETWERGIGGWGKQTQGLLESVFKVSTLPWFYTSPEKAAVYAESEAIFQKAGITEVENMADITALQRARAAVTGRGKVTEQTDISLVTQDPLKRFLGR